MVGLLRMTCVSFLTYQYYITIYRDVSITHRTQTLFPLDRWCVERQNMHTGELAIELTCE